MEDKQFGKWTDIEVELVGTLTKEDIKEILYLRDQEMNSQDIAKKVDKTLVIVNKAIVANSDKKSNTEIIEKAAPMQVGYLRKIISDKKEQNDSLRETRDSLAEQIGALWGMIHLLEQRKKSLENHIATMEDYIQKGVVFVEKHIEE